MSLKVFGQSVSKGMCFGPVYLKTDRAEDLPPEGKGSIDDEQKKLNLAVTKAKDDVNRLIEKSVRQSNSSETNSAKDVLEAHLMLLDDPELMDQSSFKIESGYSAMEAYKSVVMEFTRMFSELNDEYLKQRVHDLDDVSKRVLFYISNPNLKYDHIHIETPSILVTRDLNPSELLSIDKSKILGIALIQGSPQSHTSILCRSLEIPCLVGVKANLADISENSVAFLDSLRGELDINPIESELSEFNYRKSLFLNEQKALHSLKGKATQTKSGRLIPLGANISGPQDIASVITNDAELVGLYRTEFLFLDRAKAPTEDEQYSVYKKVFEGLGHLPMTLRTLDIGGDKTIAYLDLPKEENPFLGVRGVRLCLRYPQLFRDQLRAVLRASTATKDLSIMFPMVSTLSEVEESLAIYNDVKKDLDSKSIPYSQNIKLGVMMEVPSLAFILPELSKLVTFISIGTNDLFQYANACDRMNPELKSISDPTHLGFVRFLEYIIKTAKSVGLDVGVCGSIAHHPEIMPALIQYGVDDLSMTAQHILAARKTILDLN